MLKRKIFITVITAILILPCIVRAETYTSVNYTMINARVIVSGGNAVSANYALGDVNIGNIFGGRAESASYSFDARVKNRLYPPAPPVIDPVISPINSMNQNLSGTKERGSAIYINGYEFVPLNPELEWICTVDLLEEGENTMLVTCRNKSGLDSDVVRVTIVLDTEAPIIVIDDPDGDILVSGDRIVIEGTVDGEPYTEERDLEYGLNRITIEFSDAAGNTSRKNIKVYRVREPIGLPEV